MRDDALARQMFFGGCALLPWLWVVNVLYFRQRVYGPLPLIDYVPGGGRREKALSALAGNSGSEDGDHSQGSGPIANLPQLGGSSSSSSSGTGSTEETGLDDRSDEVPRYLMEAEVSKWVRRSIYSATVVVGAFVAWIAVFQVNKDSFGAQWFVMTKDESGW